VILGIGIDIVEVDRIRQACERFEDRFLHRILRPAELEYCRSFRSMAPHLAARFAAKEAISKAFGTGIGRQLGWLDMEVLRKDSGEPYLVLHDGGARLLKERGGGKVHISLSHTQSHAMAIAIIEAVEATRQDPA
jgi:holo-[acyl-carrier protein] synthase